MGMTVRDLVNGDFDINCPYTVYDVTDGESWHDSPAVLQNSNFKTMDGVSTTETPEILNMKIVYMTLDLEHKAIVIEAKR